MTISALLRDLATHGVRVALKGDRLQLSAAAGILTPQLRAEIAAKNVSSSADRSNAAANTIDRSAKLFCCC